MTITIEMLEEEIRELRNTIRELESRQPKWIKTEKELPPAGKHVITYGPDGAEKDVMWIEEHDGAKYWTDGEMLYTLSLNTHWSEIIKDPEE